MIRSMTGFGAARAEQAPYAVRVEIRSVNNRNIKIMTRVSERLQGMEAQIEKVIREHISRGTLQVAVTVDDISGDTGYNLDEAAAAWYLNRLGELKKRLGVEGEISIGLLASLPGVVQKPRDTSETPEALQRMVETCLREACAGMTAMREEEGRFLWKDILERCAVIEKLLAKVEARVPGMLDEFRERLAKRLSLLLAKMGDELRPEEIHREIALYTDRSDINEEISRMRSHLAQMRDCPASQEPVGRRIEFIVQEMFREANTMGSKSNDPDMIHDIVGMKSELEKLREQAFNVE